MTAGPFFTQDEERKKFSFCTENQARLHLTGKGGGKDQIGPAERSGEIWGSRQEKETLVREEEKRPGQTPLGRRAIFSLYINPGGGTITPPKKKGEKKNVRAEVDFVFPIAFGNEFSFLKGKKKGRKSGKGEVFFGLVIQSEEEKRPSLKGKETSLPQGGGEEGT